MPFHHRNTQRDQTQQPARRKENKMMETSLNHDWLQEVSMWGTVQKKAYVFVQKALLQSCGGWPQHGEGAHWEERAECRCKLKTNSSGDTSRKLNFLFQTHLWSIIKHLTQLKTLNTKKSQQLHKTKLTLDNQTSTANTISFISLTSFTKTNKTKNKNKWKVLLFLCL